MDRERIARWLDQVILALTLGFGLVFVLVEVFLEASAEPWAETSDLVFTVAFLVAFAAQVAVVEDRVAWLERNWFDVLVVVVVALPLLRMFVFYRYLPIVGRLRLVRLALILGEALHVDLRAYGRGNVHNILVTGVVIVFLGALLVRFSEQESAEANIKTLGEALWWAVTTITTVGYGDKFPTTAGGRVVAAGLMVLGIGPFGVMTASVSSLFLAQAREGELEGVRLELRALREELAALRQTLGRPLPAGAGQPAEGRPGGAAPPTGG
jgi:voltage-gated potassium channel